jgi:hypothetical protein
MPSFTIYQGEAGLRAERDRYQRENARLKAENDRLRALVGEPVAQTVAAEVIQAQRLAPPAQQGGTGDCTFQIGAPAKAPVMNPVIARARAPRAPQAAPVAPLVTDLPASTQGADAETEAENAPSSRFQLLEIR